MSDCIQGLWIGDRLSLMEQLSIKSFLANGHPYHLYVYDQVRGIPEGAAVKDANEIIPHNQIFTYSNNSYAGFANVFRYKLLLERGGWWADSDVVCLKEFSSPNACEIATERTKEDGVRPCIGVLKMPKGSEFLKACYDRALEKRRSVNVDFGDTGFNLAIPLMEQYHLQKFYASSPDIYSPVNWWDYERIIDSKFDFEIPDCARAIHLWNEMWRRQSEGKGRLRDFLGGLKFNKNRRHSPKTLYGWLQRMYL